MTNGGELTIKTENVTLDEDLCRDIPEARPGKFVCLSVADTGVGMDKETIPHIFEPFFSTKDAGKGTGLGLSVVYGIIQQHGGWINVHSNPGQGSMFKFYLPAFSAIQEDEAEVKETISLQELQGSGERILVVEDEEKVREFVTMALRESGYLVLEAASAEEALELFEREKGKFHMVFSDVVLPGKTGIQLVDQLLARKPELPVLLSSGYVDAKSHWSTIRERGFQFLQKPYALANLLRAIKETMSGYRSSSYST
ncbi:Sensor kinase CckA [subsurface metagenome]